MTKKLKYPQYYQGSAIALTLLAIAAMTTLSLGVARIVPSDFRQSQSLETSLNAENAALAGIEHALLVLREAREQQAYIELSEEYEQSNGNIAARPFSRYIPSPQDNCYTARDVCPGIDRQLGILLNGTPVTIQSLNAQDTSYRIAIWHRKQHLGNFNDLFDGLATDPILNHTRHPANINPILDRDEVRRLDVRDTTTLRLRWKPVANPDGSCNVADPNSKSWLAYTLIREDGTVGARQVREANKNAPYNEEVIGLFGTLSGISTLSLRFLVTGDEAKVANCFMRYATLNQANESTDLGFDVIESTGVSGGVKRTVRVVASRESGRVLNIFEFGVACENCQNID